MKRDATSVITISLSLLVGAFVISLVLFLLFGQERVRRTLFFPDLLSEEVHAEERIVTRRGTTRAAVQLVLEEVILGPAGINSSRVLPKSTTIDGLFVTEGTAHIDLSEEAVADSPDVRVPFEKALAILEQNVMFNFRTLQDVVITVDGQVPYVPYFELEQSETQNLENGT
ncbi:MAG: GerMN domain-containing protein [Spirochaetota bacterium]